MTTFKLLIIDVDGTLIGHGAYPSPGVTDAIRAVQAQGVTVALGTGRASEACYHLFDHLTLRGLHILFDGAAIVEWPSKDMIFLQALPPRATQHLVELSRKYNLFLEIYAHDFYFIERDGPLAEHQRQKLQLQPLITDLSGLANRIKVVKGQVLASNPAEKARADQLASEMAGFCKMSWSLDPSNGIYFGNAIANLVSKAGALRELVDYLGLQLSDTLMIGDSFNDMGIFEVAGTRVAMGHAPPALKDMADWIAPDVEHDGVAAAIEKYLL